MADARLGSHNVGFGIGNQRRNTADDGIGFPVRRISSSHFQARKNPARRFAGGDTRKDERRARMRIAEQSRDSSDDGSTLSGSDSDDVSSHEFDAD